MTTTTRLLTLGQTADRLGVSAITVSMWVRDDRCPVIRDGHKIRIPAEWVEELLALGW